ncbi:GDYXXLXY domain-containing protein [uncultured Zhongshania sp.]|uniref:GDYXXLXY domain-containing protein n=1 Tax=uncultured Zhongshania sp. TaxID=1642288 RepID=UPI0025D2942D|nr:GDYXXLXY domain-containing protein [uncultured Zhongshania sp.]
MRKILVVLLVLGQVAVLAYLGGEREWIRHNGERIFLRTAPVDPRDPFRGDFVRLSYSLNSIDVTRFRSSVSAESLKRETIVYAILKPSSTDVYQLDYLSDRKPSGGLFLRGRVSRDVSGGQIQVRYGIEQYFVQQGSGIEIERKRGSGDDLQIPMEVELAVGRSGRAVLTNYRWSRIGIRLEQIAGANEDRGEGAPPRSPVLIVTLKNVSDSLLQLADNEMHCGFSLQTEGDTGRRYSMANTRCNPFVFKPGDVINLEPGEEYRVELDTALPRWYVLQEGVAGSASIAAAAPNERFRMVYRPPVVMSGMDSNATLLWQGELTSPAFNVRGQID